VNYTARLNWFLPAAMIPGLAIVATVAETLFGILLVLGWKTRITALLSGVLLTTFALTMMIALGMKAPFDLYPSFRLLLRPEWSALAMNASTITVTLNALLLNHTRPRKD
jgi:uncharacterized membrane protein YphA (DoxX/SURF4 family)